MINDNAAHVPVAELVTTCEARLHQMEFFLDLPNERQRLDFLIKYTPVASAGSGENVTIRGSEGMAKFSRPTAELVSHIRLSANGFRRVYTLASIRNKYFNEHAPNVSMLLWTFLVFF